MHCETGEVGCRVDLGCTDGDIALSAAPLNRPDLWGEAGVRGNLWMSGRLVQTLLEADFGLDRMLPECGIVGGRP